MPQDKITVVGARVHNLKNLSVEIPRDKLVVISGISGSGKSSLAFDTIFAEGQRRYVESLSAYARQFLGQLDKPDVDSIDGLSPAVSIDQKGVSHNPRSTVGTVTEVYDYLRLLFARVGVPHCPLCGREVRQQSAEEIVDAIEALPDGTRLLILAPLVRGRKGTHQNVIEDARRSGFARLRVNGTVVPIEDEIELDRYKNHTIEAVIDRLVVHHEQGEDAEAHRTRLTDSVETALRWGNRTMIVSQTKGEGSKGGTDLPFSELLACPEHGTTLAEIEPRTFSFNTPHGACPECQGLGIKLEIDPDRIIPDRSLSITEGAIAAGEWSNQGRDRRGYYWQLVEAVAEQYDIDLDVPVSSLSKKKLDLVLFGTQGEQVSVRYQSREGRKATFKTAYEGIIGNLERRYQETQSEYMRSRIQEYMSERPCPRCGGKRLRPEALAVTVDDAGIIDVTGWPVVRTLLWVDRLQSAGGPLGKRQQQIADRVLKEIRDRLGFLVDVGLDYLTLDRSAGSLSGGEAQRIRLATQIGSRLMGVLYVLDEPSIGLHPRDNDRLIKTLEGMRDLGNSVLVVEHDEATIRAADWLIDLGPGAGEHGGEIVAQGTVAQVHAQPGLGHRPLPGGQAPHRRSGGAATGQRQVPHRRGRPREQPQEHHRPAAAGHVRVHHRRLRLGQVDADGRGASQGAGAEAQRGARAPRRPRPDRWPGVGRADHQHRSVADWPHAAVEPRHLHRAVRRRAHAVRRTARLEGARLQGRALLVQRTRWAVRSVRRSGPAADRDAVPARCVRRV